MSGECVACKSGPFADNAERLCTMCFTSPYYTNLRRKRMEELKPGTVIEGKNLLLVDGGGLRADLGKPRVDLLPGDALLELGKVYEYGSKKYAPRNWERGMPWSKMLGPLLRHLYKWMSGEKVDAESGQLHIAMVAWNAVGLLTYELRGIGTDDRKTA